MARGIANVLDALIIEVIKIISLSRLIDGGAAILIHENRNHHIVKTGVTDIMPLDNVSLRVWVIS